MKTHHILKGRIVPLIVIMVSIFLTYPALSLQSIGRSFLNDALPGCAATTYLRENSVMAFAPGSSIPEEYQLNIPTVSSSGSNIHDDGVRISRLIMVSSTENRLLVDFVARILPVLENRDIQPGSTLVVLDEDNSQGKASRVADALAASFGVQVLVDTSHVFIREARHPFLNIMLVDQHGTVVHSSQAMSPCDLTNYFEAYGGDRY